jgi:hypothetical protein
MSICVCYLIMYLYYDFLTYLRSWQLYAEDWVSEDEEITSLTERAGGARGRRGK